MGNNGRMKKPPRPLKRRTFIKEWREFRHMTLEQLAAATGMHTGSLSLLENAKRGYTQDSLELIAKALQTDEAALLTLDPGKPESVWAWLARHGQNKNIAQ